MTFPAAPHQSTIPLCFLTSTEKSDLAMLLTYQAFLRANRIEWVADAPDHLAPDANVRVFVTLLDPPPATAAEQGKRMAAALDKLAALPSNHALADPLAWQREMREDRPLSGREG